MDGASLLQVSNCSRVDRQLTAPTGCQAHHDFGRVTIEKFPVKKDKRPDTSSHLFGMYLVVSAVRLHSRGITQMETRWVMTAARGGF